MSNIKNISAENCYSAIKENKDAYLVDVRTPYEWETFGSCLLYTSDAADE